MLLGEDHCGESRGCKEFLLVVSARAVKKRKILQEKKGRIVQSQLMLSLTSEKPLESLFP